MKERAPEHTGEINTARGDALKTTPISGDKAGSTQSMSGNGNRSTTAAWTAAVRPGERTETIPVSRLARLSATARFRIFPGPKDMDAEIRHDEEVSYMPEWDDDFSASADEKNLPPISKQYDQGSPFAAGGRGILRTAKDKHLHRMVAIKALRKEFAADPDQRGAFLKEAKITAQLDHPGVIPIYSLSSDDDNNLFLSMKYIKGHTFKYYLELVDKQYAEKGVSQFDSRKALFSRLELFLRVCDAIEYAHSRNIMHCDLKPENIMLGECREVYVMDWGLARPIHVPGVTRENWVSPEKITGTPRYLSPEAVSGQFCDERSDLYTLGLILHETVTLTNAVPGENRDELILHIRDGQLAPIRHKYGIWIDNDLRAIIQKATARSLSDRYTSVGELSADLRRYLRDEEVEANPDHFLGKLVRFSRRHPGSALLLTFAMLVIAGSAMTYTLIHDLNRLYENTERDYALGESYIRCVLAARDADHLLQEQKQALHALAKSCEVLLNKKFSFDQKTAVPKTAAEKNGSLSFDTEDGSLSPEQENISSLVSMLIPNMDTLFQKNGSARKSSSHIVPRRVLFTFSNGLSAVFPAGKKTEQEKDKEEASAQNPDLREASQNTGEECFWLHGKIDGQDAFYCVQKLDLPEQKFTGSIAFAAHVPGLIRLINSAENDGGRYLLDEQGNILLCSSGVQGTKLDPRIRTAVLQRRYGYISSTEKGRRMLWCFNAIPSAGWFWLEKLPVVQQEKDGN